MAVTPKVLTVSEVAGLCGRLEGRRCSPRQVRYLLVTGGLGSEAGRRAHGQTRVYTVLDAGVTLTYLRSDLIRAWKAGAAVALTVSGLHGSLRPALKARPAGAIAYVPLLEIWRGLEAEVHKVAAGRGHVWMWRRVPVNAVPRATA
jgi:hypothetical protein